MSANLPDPPACSFASDNTAGAHPRVLEAVVSANDGPAGPYGADRWSARAADALRAEFDTDATVLFTWGGTGANVVGLQAMLRPHEAVVCPATAHINVDEAGAPERLLGVKLIDLATPDGKLTPALLDAAADRIDDVRGVVHHSQPRVLSVAQATETGRVYTAEEQDQLVDAARSRDLLVHMDGARFANALAHRGGAAARAVSGVDVLSLGGTKNGALGAEAVMVFDPALAHAATFARKQAGQLASKMRFVAAQFVALLADGLWIELAAHANAMARRLADGAGVVDGVSIDQPPEANAVFATLPPVAAERLAAWSPFHVWDRRRGLVRWMASWQTTEADVDRFVAGLAVVMAR